MTNDDLEALVTCFCEMGLSYEEFCNALRGSSRDVKPLKRLIGNPYASSIDSWLLKVGIALIAFPDPTVTDVIGSILVAVGLAKRRMRQLTMADISIEFRDVTKSLGSIRQELSYCLV